MFFNNPIMALILIFIIYAVIDRRFIGSLPDFSKAFQNWRKTAALKQELECTPSPGRIYYELGALQVERGKMEEGRSNLEKAHELISEHPDIEYYLGVARIKTNALDEGKAALEYAIQLNPKVKYGFPYIYLIEYSLKKHESQEQIDEYMDKIYSNSNPQLLYELGIIFQKEGYTEKAREMFQEVRSSLKQCPSFMKKQYRYFAIMAAIRTMFTL
jgi:tetratricopeptide (TPR) repeat protein